jgi:hypothetical protein
VNNHAGVHETPSPPERAGELAKGALGDSSRPAGRVWIIVGIVTLLIGLGLGWAMSMAGT